MATPGPPSAPPPGASPDDISDKVGSDVSHQGGWCDISNKGGGVTSAMPTESEIDSNVTSFYRWMDGHVCVVVGTIQFDII